MTAKYHGRGVPVALMCVALLTGLIASPVRAQTGGGFDLTWSTIDGGGGTSVTDGYELSGTIGQADAGSSSFGGFILSGGFWPGIASASGCVGDCNGDGEVSIDELLTMASIALGNAAVSHCRAGDPGGNGRITIDEICIGANNALGVCP